jgi:hypothetical protein
MSRRPLFIFAAAALVFTAAEPALAACGSTRAVQVGGVSGDPEKDTFGLLFGPTDVEQTSLITRSARRVMLQAGATTGEAEKDTLSYLQNGGSLVTLAL